MPSQHPVIIIGAGLAGLSCAAELTRAGLEVLILEAADDIGGRVRTDRVEGFSLDRGFQVLQTAYPEAARLLDYDALDLRPFEPGALVRVDGEFQRVCDPLRRPGTLLDGLRSSVGGLKDKWGILRWRRQARSGDPERFLEGEEVSSSDWLQSFGFSARILETFFKPFYGGVFLEDGLETSSHILQYTFAMFTRGSAALPAEGMQAVPRALAAQLPEGSIRCAHPVVRASSRSVELVSGSSLSAQAVVRATPRDLYDSAEDSRPWKAVGCLYFDAPRPPVEEPLLVLNGEGEGPINSLCVPSQLSSALAPSGRSLVSVSVSEAQLDAHGAGLNQAVREQLSAWFPQEDVEGWRLLRSQRIDWALPSSRPGELRRVLEPKPSADGTWRCGDHLELPSIQGAMASGVRTARAILQTL